MREVSESDKYEIIGHPDVLGITPTYPVPRLPSSSPSFVVCLSGPGSQESRYRLASVESFSHKHHPTPKKSIRLLIKCAFERERELSNAPFIASSSLIDTYRLPSSLPDDVITAKREREEREREKNDVYERERRDRLIEYKKSMVKTRAKKSEGKKKKRKSKRERERERERERQRGRERD